MNGNLIHHLQILPVIFNEHCFSKRGLDFLTLVERSVHDAYKNIRSRHRSSSTCSAASARKSTWLLHAWFQWEGKESGKLELDWNNYSMSSWHGLYLILFCVIPLVSDVTLSWSHTRNEASSHTHTDRPVTTQSYIHTSEDQNETRSLRCGLRREDGWMNRLLFWQSQRDRG